MVLINNYFYDLPDDIIKEINDINQKTLYNETIIKILLEEKTTILKQISYNIRLLIHNKLIYNDDFDENSYIFSLIGYLWGENVNISGIIYDDLNYDILDFKTEELTLWESWVNL